MGLPVLPEPVCQRAVLAHALILGMAVSEFDPSSKAAPEISTLAQFVEQHLCQQPAQASPA